MNVEALEDEKTARLDEYQLIICKFIEKEPICRRRKKEGYFTFWSYSFFFDFCLLDGKQVVVNLHFSKFFRLRVTQGKHRSFSSVKNIN